MRTDYESISDIITNNNDYYLIKDTKDTTIIVIVSDGISKPQCIQTDNTLFIGYDLYYCVIKNSEIIYQNCSFGAFYEMVIPKNLCNRIISILEIGVMCFDYDGDLKWICDAHDLIEDYMFNSKYITVYTDGGDFLINIETGIKASLNNNPV